MYTVQLKISDKVAKKDKVQEVLDRDQALVGGAGRAMNKAELIDRVARDTGLTKADCAARHRRLADNVTKRPARGEKVTLVGFGTFQTTRRVARTGRNPQTGIPSASPPAGCRSSCPGKS